MTTVAAVRVADFEPVIEGMYLVAATAGPRGEPLLLASNNPPSHDKDGTRRPPHLRIYRLEGDAWKRHEIHQACEHPAFVQPLPGGRWLLARHVPRPGSADTAWIHGADGEPLGAFDAGIDIRQVQTTAGGSVWIGYGDEGIYRENRFSSEGVVTVDEAGREIFRFSSVWKDAPTIDACTAMNVVSDQETWLCYYSAFPIVRLSEGRVSCLWPHSPVQRSGAFALSGDRALFAGSHDRPGSLFLVKLGFLRRDEMEPVDPAGRPIPFTKAFARGPLLFLQTEGSLFRVDLAAL